MSKYIINPCSGMKIEVVKGQTIEIVDIDGGQVVDFFAEMRNHSDEFVSPGVTIDCNESLRLNVGDIIYSNKYTPMFRIIYDDVKEHDLIHPCCTTSRQVLSEQNPSVRSLLTHLLRLLLMQFTGQQAFGIEHCLSRPKRLPCL